MLYEVALYAPEPDEWRKDALCAGLDLDVFYPPPGGARRLPVSICKNCPVRHECLDFALKAEGADAACDRHGYFGGLSPNERYAEYKASQAGAVCV